PGSPRSADIREEVVSRRPDRQAYQLGFSFFFQAEDGIRDGHVTGVQTCALPIWPSRFAPHASGDECKPRWPPRRRHSRPAGIARSEERRVGKECRALGPLDPSKKKVIEDVDDQGE